MLPHFYGLDHEQFWGLLLNNSNKPIRKFRISQGDWRQSMRAM